MNVSICPIYGLFRQCRRSTYMDCNRKTMVLFVCKCKEVTAEGLSLCNSSDTLHLRIIYRVLMRTESVYLNMQTALFRIPFCIKE